MWNRAWWDGRVRVIPIVSGRFLHCSRDDVYISRVCRADDVALVEADAHEVRAERLAVHGRVLGPGDAVGVEHDLAEVDVALDGRI